MSVTYEQAINFFKERKFFLITHPVVIHHMRKDFSDYDVTRDRFYILPVGDDFLHAAVVEYQDSNKKLSVQVRYTCAGDDLLYGLRTKYTSGGSEYPETDLHEILYMIRNVNRKNLRRDAPGTTIRNHPRYIRKRFRHGRSKAKLRATIIMLRDMWRALWA